MNGLAYYFPLFVAIGFIVAALCMIVAVWHSGNPTVRKSFIALFFVGLLAVNLVPVPAPLPFSNLHKYTETSSNPTTYYDVYLIDEDGNELRYDGNAAPPSGTLIRFGRGIATEYSEPKARSTADHLLDRGITYRQHIENDRGIDHHVDFPPHALGYSWDRDLLAEYDDFVELRVYHVELRYTESGLAIEERDQTPMASLTTEGEFTRNETTH